MNTECPTSMHCYAQNMDRKKFIQTSAEEFIKSGRNQLMLLYRIGVSQQEARYITKRIKTIVEKENPETMIRSYTNVDAYSFNIFSKKQD